MIQLREITVSYKKTERLNVIKIAGSGDAYKYINAVYKGNPESEAVEFAYAIYLNRQNRVMGHKLIGQGGTSGCVIDPKVVFSVGLSMMAEAIILVHNHPSGNLKPSRADIELTKNLCAGGKVLEMNVLDHLIYTHEGDYFSFADEGLL